MKKQQMAGLSIVGILLFNAPILKLANFEIEAITIPPSLFYLFFFWGILITIAAWINLKKEPSTTIMFQEIETSSEIEKTEKKKAREDSRNPEKIQGLE